jgi:3-deoxy-D-manno-octulosonic-acid transferase
VAAIVALPWFAWQVFRHGKYLGSLAERLGRVPVGINVDGDASIWVHAVSVGEAMAARPLLAGLRERYPTLKIFVTTTTATGQAIARTRLQPVDGVCYFPIDLPGSVGRFLDVLRPHALLIMETELWPNVLRACRARGITTMLVNGRLSPRSFGRYRALRPFMRRVVGDLDTIAVQTSDVAAKFIALGADPSAVLVTGSLKFDAVDPAAGKRDRVLRFFKVRLGRPVVIAASTLEGEDEPVLRAFRRARLRYRDALLILVPRHPERFTDVVALCASEGFRVERRTALPIDVEPKADVIVLDTIGELAALFEVATVVFVGGSLVKAGGHNIVEPAAHGKPVIFGPHMENFADIARTFLDQHGAVQVGSAGDLADALVALLDDPVRRATLGATARGIVEANRGATLRTLEALGRRLPQTTARGAVIHHFPKAR